MSNSIKRITIKSKAVKQNIITTEVPNEVVPVASALVTTPSQYPKVDLRGMGGKEKEILKLFPNLKRENHALYDFVEENGVKIEVKKTQFKRLQSWIDPVKYLNLSEDDRKIIFRFVYFNNDNGECLEVVDTTLGDVVDRFIPVDITEPTLKIVSLFPKKSQLQFKLNILWR